MEAETLETNFTHNLIETQTFSLKEINFHMPLQNVGHCVQSGLSMFFNQD